MRFRPDAVVIGNREHYPKLKEMLRDLPVKVYAGSEAIEQVAAAGNSDTVLAAMVGYSGLKPALRAAEAGKKIALANKESLVVAGHLFHDTMKSSGSVIIPVDSEHSAIFQCLAGEGDNSLEKITLTASGGPFRGYSSEQLGKVEPAEALKHPNWEMGSKITVDSASMMNKGLEVIEAHWLFGLPSNKIDVVIHPQSIIHSMVHFSDGSVKAQMGLPDMRLPIVYSLSYPGRLANNLPRMELPDYSNLTFFKPDMQIFRNLALAYQALEAGGNMPCALNSANEVAVAAFLRKELGFLEMSDVVEYVMGRVPQIANPTLGEIGETDMRGRDYAREFINRR